jgi:hypothetical protein
LFQFWSNGRCNNNITLRRLFCTEYVSGQSEEIKHIDTELLNYNEMLRVVKDYYNITDICKPHYKISKNYIDNGLRTLFHETSISEMIALLCVHICSSLYGIAIYRIAIQTN